MKLSTIWLDGLWDRNPGLIQLLGLCPLLAVSNTLENAVGLDLATLFVLVLSNASISLIRTLVDDAIRLPVFVLVIAALTTCAELLVQALDYQLYQSLGIFLPLIVTNCLIIGRSESFASRHTLADSLRDALAMGIGFLWVLVSLGGIRELIGQGTLLDEAHILFGKQAENWTLYVFNADHGILLALLPPGAFITLGLLLAGKDKLDETLSTTNGPAK